MSLNKIPYRGTRDFFPSDKRMLNYLCQIMAQTAESMGYEPYDGPLLEEVDLYKAKSGEELINDQIYSFMDRGERHVAIRPEMTPTLARMVAQIHREEIKPIRWFAIPNLMRYEKPQRGRVREHWQFNADIFGAPKDMGEAEILFLACRLFKNFGADFSQFEILINDRRIVEFLFKTKLQVDEETQYKLYKLLDKSKKIPNEVLQKEMLMLLKEEEKCLIFNTYLSLNSFENLVEFLGDNELTINFKNFLLKIESIKDVVKFDPTIVRGLDYYTGLVFEIFDKNPENRRALCGGGAYDNLLAIFGEPPLSGVGMGLGDVTLRDFLEVHNLLPRFNLPKNDFVVSFQTAHAECIAINIAERLRNKGYKVITLLREEKIKKVFSFAEKKGCEKVIFIGEDELAQNKFQIKNLVSKEQILINIDNLENEI